MLLLPRTDSTRRTLAVAAHWLPRLLAAAFALRCFVLAAFSWADALDAVDRAMAVSRYVLPGILATGVLLASRWSSRIAAVACVAIAMLYAVLPDARIAWIFRVAAPLMVEGALFMLDSRIHAGAHRLARHGLSRS